MISALIRKTRACLLLLCLSTQISAQVEVTVDISQVDTTGFNHFVYATNQGYHFLYLDKPLTIQVERLPTLIELKTSDDIMLVNSKYLWATTQEIVLKGSIRQGTLEPVTKVAGQEMADKVFAATFEELEQDATLRYTPAYALLLYRDRNITEIAEFKEYIKLAPEDLRSFWVFSKLEDIVERYDNLGYNEKTEVLTGFNVLTRSGERRSYQLTNQKPLLLSLISPNCYKCDRDIERLAVLHSRYNDKIDLLTMWDDESSNTIRSLHFFDEDLIKWPNYWDEDLLLNKKLGIEKEAAHILFDKEGKIIKRWNKPPKNLNKYLRD